MSIFKTKSPKETEEVGKKLGSALKSGDVVAMFGGMGMGKTAFTHGIAEGMGIDPHQVSSPTFALVQEYGERQKLYHFDMYRIGSWDDLYSTGFFDYLCPYTDVRSSILFGLKFSVIIITYPYSDSNGFGISHNPFITVTLCCT